MSRQLWNSLCIARHYIEYMYIIVIFGYIVELATKLYRDITIVEVDLTFSRLIQFY